jgi:hypothetical protein
VEVHNEPNPFTAFKVVQCLLVIPARKKLNSGVVNYLVHSRLPWSVVKALVGRMDKAYWLNGIHC